MATNFIWTMCSADSAVIQTATLLAGKKDSLVPGKVIKKLDAEDGNITENDKLTIVGHGNPEARRGEEKLGGMTPEQLAIRVANSPFLNVGKIVLLMCGEPSGRATHLFAKAMKDHGYRGKVVGYTDKVAVDANGRRFIESEHDDAVKSLGITVFGRVWDVKLKIDCRDELPTIPN